MNQADIDIDLPTSFKPEEVFPDWVKAMIFDEKNQAVKPHPCGVYPQAIPRDPISGLCAIPYDVAESFGYVKLDFLHLTIYDHFTSREEIVELLEIDPDWNLLLAPSVVEQLFQLSNHFEVVSKAKPRSTEDLADVLALFVLVNEAFLAFTKKTRRLAESCFTQKGIPTNTPSKRRTQFRTRWSYNYNYT